MKCFVCMHYGSTWYACDGRRYRRPADQVGEGGPSKGGMSYDEVFKGLPILWIIRYKNSFMGINAT